MPRTPYAARVLVAEVLSENSKAEVDWSGEVDGLDVDRSVRFDKDTSAWLHPALEKMGDERIVDLNMTEAGYLHVTFSSASPLADSRAPFYVEQLRKMVSDEEPASGPKASSRRAPAGDDSTGKTDSES